MISNFWYYYINLLKAQKMFSIFFNQQSIFKLKCVHYFLDKMLQHT